MRGSLLVAAVFDAFVTIYKSRIADLIRIATSGTGVLPAGQLHPDLVNRLAGEASKSAQHVLNMCIRALDYCPPVDLTFGDYLRASPTDYDLVHDDDLGYASLLSKPSAGLYPRCPQPVGRVCVAATTSSQAALAPGRSSPPRQNARVECHRTQPRDL
jgi:hypothetical protein